MSIMQIVRMFFWLFIPLQAYGFGLDTLKLWLVLIIPGWLALLATGPSGGIVEPGLSVLHRSGTLWFWA